MLGEHITCSLPFFECRSDEKNMNSEDSFWWFLLFPCLPGIFMLVSYTVWRIKLWTMWHESYYEPYYMAHIIWWSMTRITNLTKYFSSHCIVHWWSGKVETTSYAPKNLSCPKYPKSYSPWYGYRISNLFNSTLLLLSCVLKIHPTKKYKKSKRTSKVAPTPV